MFNEKLNADSLFLSDLMALRKMDVFPRHFPLIPMRSANPQVVSGAFPGPRPDLLGAPQVLRWARAANLRMQFGRILVRGRKLGSDFKE